MPPDATNEMTKVARSVRIPIATGERVTTKVEFAHILRSGAARILQPALGRAGGIWEAKNCYFGRGIQRTNIIALVRRTSGVGSKYSIGIINPQYFDVRNN